MGKALRPEVDEINHLASALHGSDAAAVQFTLGSLREHVDEVGELLEAGDEHWKAETMDIIIHGLTLLRRGDVSEKGFEALMTQRLARFKEKIGQVLDRERVTPERVPCGRVGRVPRAPQGAKAAGPAKRS